MDREKTVRLFCYLQQLAARFRGSVVAGHLALFLVLWFVPATGGIAQEALDPEVILDTYYLVMGGRLSPEMKALQVQALGENPDKEYIERQWARLLPEQMRLRLEEIRTRPGLKPYLLRHIAKYYHDRSDEVRNFLEALAEREDLLPEDVEPIREEVIKLLQRPVDSNYSYEGVYVQGAIAVIARDPTPANRELLLRLLKWPAEPGMRIRDVDDPKKEPIAWDDPKAGDLRIKALGTGYPINAKAAQALARLGATWALPAIDEQIRRMKAIDREADLIEEARDQLLGILNPPPAPEPVAVATPVPKPTPSEFFLHEQKQLQQVARKSGSSTKWVWVGSGLGVIGLLVCGGLMWTIQRRRRRL